MIAVRRTSGSCLCGGVTVRLPRPMDDVGVCHCATCRQWGSGPWMSLQAPGTIVSGDTLVRYHASAFAERGFCGRCGTHVFHRPQDGPELAISAGLFGDAPFHIAREIFFDAKPPFYTFIADSEKRTTASMAREWLPKVIVRRVRRWIGRPSPSQGIYP